MRSRNMNSWVILAAMLSAWAGSAAHFAQAQAIGQPFAFVQPFQLNFDEAGTSLLNAGPNPNLVSPVTGGGIDFYLPGPVTPGQILINAPMDINSANPNGDSDLLTFSNGPGLNGIITGIMRDESLADPFDPVLAADVQRLNYLQPILTITETGIEGNNGFSYIVPGPRTTASATGCSTRLLRNPRAGSSGQCAALSLAAWAHRRRQARFAPRARAPRPDARAKEKAEQRAKAILVHVEPAAGGNPMRTSRRWPLGTQVCHAQLARIRSAFCWRSVALALWLAHVGGVALPAAQLIQYLQVPSTGNLISGSTFNLPNYGTVQVSIAGESATFFDQLNAYNQSAGLYTWGTDTQRLNILNTTAAPVNYTLNFAFQSGMCPTPATCCSM